MRTAACLVVAIFFGACAPESGNESGDLELAVEALAEGVELRFDILVSFQDIHDDTRFIQAIQLTDRPANQGQAFVGTLPCHPGVGKVDVVAREMQGSITRGAAKQTAVYLCTGGQKSPVAIHLTIPVEADAGFAGLAVTVDELVVASNAAIEDPGVAATSLAVQHATPDDAPALFYLAPPSPLSLLTSVAGEDVGGGDGLLTFLDARWALPKPGTSWDRFEPVALALPQAHPVGELFVAGLPIVHYSMSSGGDQPSATAVVEPSLASVQCNERVTVVMNVVPSSGEVGLFQCNGLALLGADQAFPGKVSPATRTVYLARDKDGNVEDIIGIGVHQLGDHDFAIIVIDRNDTGRIRAARCSAPDDAPPSCATDAPDSGFLLLESVAKVIGPELS
jgi:hypothetical protein